MQADVSEECVHIVGFFIAIFGRLSVDAAIFFTTGLGKNTELNETLEYALTLLPWLSPYFKSYTRPS